MKKFSLALLPLILFSFALRPATITDKERKDAVDLLQKTEQGVFDAIKGLSDAQLKYKPAPDRWSIEECVKHIAVTEQGLWQMASGAIQAAANPKKELI